MTGIHEDFCTPPEGSTEVLRGGVAVLVGRSPFSGGVPHIQCKLVVMAIDGAREPGGAVRELSSPSRVVIGVWWLGGEHTPRGEL